ncbi:MULTISPECIES: ABC transporter permease [unclassified Streptomyces]|uniref:ABC transporter permease n=1 Tax=unclassified Streptomyces TaxID=2593676 RepID=UPI0011B93BE6|nr:MULTISPECIES: ABC transporter permease [unclassified Streptomyces]
MRQQLLNHWARSLALLVGILVAVSSFAVLSATTESARLTVTGTVGDSRGAYDLLIRPPEAAQGLETERGLIRPNSLSDVYGGLTRAQLAAVRRVPGVEVAAPLEVLGYATEPGSVSIDLAGLVPDGTRGTYELGRTWSYDRGLSTIRQRPHTVFITPYPLETRPGKRVVRQEADGRAEYLTNRYFEVLPSGERREVCKGGLRAEEQSRGLSPAVTCLSWSGITARGEQPGTQHSGPWTRVVFSFPVSYVIAGVDPEAEAGLSDLANAVTRGRYLTSAPPRQVPGRGGEAPGAVLPMLRSADASSDLAVAVTLSREDDGHQILSKRFDAGSRQLEHAVGKRSQAVLGSLQATGPVTYDTDGDGTVRPRTVSRPDKEVAALPLDGRDLWFRSLVPQGEQGERPPAVPEIVGSFDPGLLPGFDTASRVPLGTYTQPELTGADARSRKLLGGKPLRPASSPTSYIQQPPLLLTSTAAADWLGAHGYLTSGQAAAPISAIRVRVAGVTGADAASRERVRLAAEAIGRVPGLRVDIVLGSSPAPLTVELPAGEHGRPVLALTEWWSKKNVASRIVRASDTKSLVLLGLVLVVCVLFVANAAASSVRSRRSEWGLLTAVGWRRRHLFGVVLGELLLLGTVAGLLGAAAAWGAARALGVDASATHVLSAVPVALAVAAASGAVPAWLASRVQPVTALRPAAATGSRARMFAGVTGLAVANAVRARGRSLLGAMAVATATAATLLLLAATYAFRGTLAGSLLGETISVQVRSADVAAVVTMSVLSVVAVGDVLYLGVRERAAEFALLRAVGWGDGVVTRLVLLEGALIGLAGSLAGVLLGGAAVLRLSPGGWTALLPAACGVVAAGPVLAAAAGFVPVLIQRRHPTTRLLAEE